MNYMSSNYPDAEDFDTPGTGSDKGFFYDVSDPNYDLTKVFTEIAHQSGGSTTSLSAASSNVDVVSHSFMLPEGTDSDNIDNSFTFSNTPIENINVKVRHAESKATNIFKPGVVEGNVIYDDTKTNTRTKTNTNTTE